MACFCFSQTSRPRLKTVFCGWAIHTHLHPHLLPAGVYLAPSLLPWPVSPAHRFKGCNQQTGQHYLQVKKQRNWSYWLSVRKCCFWLPCNAQCFKTTIILYIICSSKTSVALPDTQSTLSGLYYRCRCLASDDPAVSSPRRGKPALSISRLDSSKLWGESSAGSCTEDV